MKTSSPVDTVIYLDIKTINNADVGLDLDINNK